MYEVRTICTKLGRNKSIALPVFHGFTGTDTTLAFRGKRRETAGSTWERFSEITDAFLFMTEEKPFYHVTAEATNFKTLEHYKVLVYGRGINTDNTNCVR